MSGGIHALEGFTYQDVVILYLILEYLCGFGDEVYFRPEGKDDFVVDFKLKGEKTFFQIKKPKKNNQFKRTYERWSLSKIISDILPNTIENLKNDLSTQVWILGDDVDDSVINLLKVKDSNRFQSEEYFQALHILAKNGSKILSKIKDKSQKQTLELWRPVCNRELNSNNFTGCFETFLKKVEGLNCNSYNNLLIEYDNILPDILSRIELKSNYGTDEEYKNKIVAKLEQIFSLKKEVLESLRNNLLWYVQDISIQKDRWITREEFELEVREVWPTMNLVKMPPEIKTEHIERLELLREIDNKVNANKTVEVIGVSGSGKTSLSPFILKKFKSQHQNAVTLYLEVNKTDSFRDLLSGICFYLHRFNIKEPFSEAINHEASTIDLVEKLANALSKIKLPCLAVIDFREGSCSDLFDLEMAHFLKSLPESSPFKMIFLAQESPIKNITVFDRKTYKIPEKTTVYGFDCDEFFNYYKKINPECKDRDYADLCSIHTNITANRESGLTARLASALVKFSIAEMQSFKNIPPKEILELADKEKYDRISTSHLKTTADKLLCFILPFEEEEAQNIFPGGRVHEAIKELKGLGLLQKISNDRYEFHETIRKGLVSNIPAIKRKEYNKTLADAYLSENNNIMAVMHFENAGEKDRANKLAKEMILSNKDVSGIMHYIRKHKLVTIDEVLVFIKENDKVESAYLFTNLILSFVDSSLSEKLLVILREKLQKGHNDYNTMQMVVETILKNDKNKLFDLIRLGLNYENEKTFPVLDYYMNRITRNIEFDLDTRIVQLFKQTANSKYVLSKLFLRLNVPEYQKLSLEYLNNSNKDITSDWDMKNIFSLIFRNKDRTRIFLQMLPSVDVAQMSVLKSVLLGKFEYFIWENQATLRTNCVEILNEEKDWQIIKNAIRVLIFISESQVIKYIEENSRNSKEIEAFLLLLPVFFENEIDIDFYETILLDETSEKEKRISAFLILFCTKGFDQIFDKLIRQDSNQKIWKFLYLMNSIQYPRKRALPLLAEKIENAKSEKDCSIYAPLLLMLSEFDGKDVDKLLISLVDSKFKSVRENIYRAYNHRRNKKAGDQIKKRYEEETDPYLKLLSFAATTACYPKEIFTKKPNLIQSDQFDAWQSVLIGRLRDTKNTEYLINVALDKNKHWSARRAAVLASAYLPFEKALEKIYASILNEKILFEIDVCPSFSSHRILLYIQPELFYEIKNIFNKGQDFFVNNLGTVFDSWKEGMMGRQPLEGVKIARWFYDELLNEGFQENERAIFIIMDKLRTPLLHAAVLRGLRKAGHIEIIEKVMLTSNYEWLFIRSLVEWFKQDKINVEKIKVIEEIIKSSNFPESYSARSILSDFIRRSEERTLQKKAIIDFVASEKELLEIDLEMIKSCLSGQDKLPDNKAIKFKGVTINEYQTIVELVGKEENHSSRGIKQVHIRPRYTGDGVSVAQNSYTSHSNDSNQNLRLKLKAIVAANNEYGIDISWHKECLQKRYVAEKYIKYLLFAYADSGEKDLFYKELENNGYLLISHFEPNNKVGRLFDKRIIPFINKYAFSGSDKTLLILCRIANFLSCPEIDEALSNLFLRCVNRIKEEYSSPTRNQNTELWQALTALMCHGKIKNIHGYNQRLIEILNTNIPWDKRKILKAISDNPKSYIKFEQELFKAEPFEHYGYDMVDFLDDTADKLFRLE